MGDEDIHVGIVIVLLFILICVGMHRYSQPDTFRGPGPRAGYYGGYGRRYRPGYVGRTYYDSPW